MKFAINIFLFLAAFTIFSAENRTYFCYKLKNPPVVNGKTDNSSAWDNIPEATGFLRAGTKTYASKQTSFKMGYTDDAIYLRVQCEEPDIDLVVSKRGDKNGSIWSEDSITVFLFPQGHAEYFGFFINAIGSRFNAIGWGGKLPPQDDYNWQASTVKNENSWDVEIRIPFSVLKAVPHDGDVWKGNVNREVITSGEETTWAYLGGSGFHDSENFATIVFKEKILSLEEKNTVEEEIDKQQEGLKQKIKDQISSCLEQTQALMGPLAASNAENRQKCSTLKEELDEISEKLQEKRSTPQEYLKLQTEARSLLQKANKMESKLIVRDLLQE